MGHLGRVPDLYQALLARIGEGPVAMPEPKAAEAREAWLDLLGILFPPEEAALAARLPLLPTDLKTLSEKLGLPIEELRRRLEPMCDRGLVMDLVHPETGRVTYFFAPPVVGFFEFSMMRAKDMLPKERLAKAYEAYAFGDKTFAAEAMGGETALSRALVHETALDGLPDVLDWERATEIIRSSRCAAVSLCYCRHEKKETGQACDAPLENCLSLNAAAEFVVRRKFGRPVEKAEALDILAASRESGLAQLGDNVRNRPNFICNCCPCCCVLLQGVNKFGLPAVNPSGFLASLDETGCNGCSRCARACPVQAISMTPSRSPARRPNALLARVDASQCIGCGVCADACPKDSLAMVRRSERPEVPADAAEKLVRMTLERGRLPTLLCEAADRGPKMLMRLLAALASLPAAQKLLARRQVRSRFLGYFLSRVKDPTA